MPMCQCLIVTRKAQDALFSTSAMSLWNDGCAIMLQAYISGPLAKAAGQEAARLQRTVALLLAPTLEALGSHAAMQVRIADYLLLCQSCQKPFCDIERYAAAGADPGALGDHAAMHVMLLVLLNLSCSTWPPLTEPHSRAPLQHVTLLLAPRLPCTRD